MATTVDPVCDMSIEALTAAASSSHQGVTYYFCSPACQKSFAAEPSKFIAAGPGGAARQGHHSPGNGHGR